MSSVYGLPRTISSRFSGLSSFVVIRLASSAVSQLIGRSMGRFANDAATGLPKQLVYVGHLTASGSAS
jgi:hypothetical protein